MSKRFDFGGVNLRAGDECAGAQPASEIPFCIAVLGDFSGRANRGIFEPKTVGERRTHLVDRDNFDEVMSKLHPELHLSVESKVPLVFRFSELDDLHPDQLFENEAFQQLKDVRERLRDPATFKETAEKLGMFRDPPPSSAPVNESPRGAAPNPVRLASSSLLDEMIEQTESKIALEPRRRTDEVQEFARQLAAKYAVSAPDARQPAVIAAVDRAIGDAMRAVLHHPDFQALEAIWRATFLLVRQLETSPNLKILLVDISKQELAADLSADDLPRSGLYRLLVEKTVETLGADPVTIVVGAFRFGSVGDNVELLPKLGTIAQRAGAALLGEADPALVGCLSLDRTPSPRDWKLSELQDSWSRIRLRPESASLGMAMPRFLLRLPYGSETSPLESFEFEEFLGAPSHEAYLWGNPAFALALLLGGSFSTAGWEMRPGSVSQLENLPLHTYKVDGESLSKPCAEVLLTEEAVERILDQGLIPLVSYRGRDWVRVARFQSVADPPRPLRGRWEA